MDKSNFVYMYKNLSQINGPNCFYTSSSLSSHLSFFYLNLTLILIFSLSIYFGIGDKQNGA